MSAPASLRDILSPEAIVGWDAAAGLSGPAGHSAPVSVVRPGSEAEVAALLEWATAEGVGVRPAGSTERVELSADRPWVALSCDRLAGIDAYDPADLTLTAGAGTPFGEVDDALRAHQQWAPFDPPRVRSRTLGGLVADGSSGPLWAGYGELRNHVLGLNVVTGDGRTLRLGGRVVKNVAGFDQVKAMVGSHGTLAVITSVCMRAFPVPVVDRVLVLTGDSLAALVPTALRVGTAPILPASTVLVAGSSAAPAGADAALVVRLHGARSTVDADQTAIERHVGVSFSSLGDGPETGSTTDSPRAALLRAYRDGGADAPTALQASVRPSRLKAMLEALEALRPESLVIDACSGSARLGGARMERAAVETARTAVEGLGGALRVTRWPDASAPNSSSPSTDEVGLTRRLRDAFDPAGVLWPSYR